MGLAFDAAGNLFVSDASTGSIKKLTPSKKMGVYMGIFNFFITFPQIVNGICGGPIVKYFYHGHAIYALVLAGIFMICGAISVLYVQDSEDVRIKKADLNV